MRLFETLFLYNIYVSYYSLLNFNLWALTTPVIPNEGLHENKKLSFYSFLIKITDGNIVI